MGRRVLIAAAIASLAAAAGCERRSKLYCEKHPDDFGECGYNDAAIDSRPPCTGNQDCVPPAPLCEPTARVCVQCLSDQDCTQPDKGVCNLETFQCQGCAAHADCPSLACLPSGTCGDDASVAYVDAAAAAANTQCTQLAPCDTIAKALETQRPYVKLQASHTEQVVFDGVTVTLLASPGTTLTNNGIVIDVKMSSDVTIYDLHVVGNGEKGIEVTASSLRVVRVTITDCNVKDKPAIKATGGSVIVSRALIHSNSGGGIDASPTTSFNITNSYIYRNGSDANAIGGARLLPPTSGQNRFEMNTVVDNRAELTAVGGVNCAAGGLVAPNNLVVRNHVPVGGVSPNIRATGGCDFNQSMVDTDVAPYAFVMPDGAGPWDYHVRAGSMAIDRAVTSDLGFDFDGDLRPQGTARDVGADEYK